MTTEARAPVATYALTIHAPHEVSAPFLAQLNMRLATVMQETEENITDFLPGEWWVEIHEWDEPGPRGQIMWRDPEDDSGFYVPGAEGDNE